MAKKKELSAEIKLLKAKLPGGKVVVGAERVLKKLNAGGLEKIFLASNCPPKIKSDLLHDAGLVKVTVIDLEQNNEELGVLCKKNFFISVLGIVEE